MATDPFEAIKATYFLECEELLADLERHVMALESGDADSDTLHAAFRAVHSIKGGAGAFGLEDLVRFAHVFETFMDELRSGRKPCSEQAVRVMLAASDVLADHVAAARGSNAALDHARVAHVVADLEALTAGTAPSAPGALAAAAPEPDGPAPDEFGFTPVAFDFGLGDAPAEPQGWRIHFKPHPRLLETGNDPALILRELARLGPCDVTLDDRDLPGVDVLEDGAFHLAWDIVLNAAPPETAVREVFEFVDGFCDLVIAPLGAEAEAEPVAALIEAPSDPVFATAPIQMEAASAPAPARAAEPAASAKPAAGGGGGGGTAGAAPSQTSIRVDLDRIDKLINVVGELVIQQAMLAQSVVESGLARSSAVSVGLEDLEQLTREIQESVMAIRAQPVKAVFQRMPRLVREVAELTGKSVRLVTEGEGTEVDKTVIDRLAEPITHMIRNAIDHGLEDPDARRRAGKDPEGVIRLAALHRSGRIVIEVSDDGRGINRDRVRAIAVERGLIAADAPLTNEEIDNLIFLPGFSTASTVSDISGRGVGMDVVKRSIQQLGGRISIASTPGKGSTFTMSLPLTLAVLDGMVVEAGGQTLLAPLSAVVESFTPKAADLHRIGPTETLIRFRDRFLPLIDTAAALGFPAAPMQQSGARGIAIVVESEGGMQAALRVDGIHGQRQVVIKSLETNYTKVDGVSAATILGDGRVALILDVDALLSLGKRAGTPADLRLAS
ncbi:MAG: chemotaxis protein CheA [Alphaproteobacteria bacterium]|nr:chemotaxis protein CheA [Alphaproteobacteria bacterium]